MKVFTKLMVAACLVCAAPLALACDVKHCDEHAAATFKAMDKNGDGVISKKEFDEFHNAHFKEIDTNHDGKISREEMDAAHGNMADKCPVQRDKCLDEMDKEGKISKDEMGGAMLRHKKMHAEHCDEMKKEEPKKTDAK